MKIILTSLLFSLTVFAQSDSSRAIGFYSNGRIENSVELPQQGKGFMRLFVEHDRGHGTSEIINMIVNAAADMNNLYPTKGRLQVEDIAARYGGPVNENHKSHQNGLDADITYFRSNGTEHVPYQEGTKYGAVMVKDGMVTSLFDSERTWQVIKLFHKHARVQRIFMDQVIKGELCRYAKSIKDFNVEVLRSIRHQDNHADHMHVRLRCPTQDKGCTPQGEVPAGSGCPAMTENPRPSAPVAKAESRPVPQVIVSEPEPQTFPVYPENNDSNQDMTIEPDYFSDDYSDPYVPFNDENYDIYENADEWPAEEMI